MMSRPDTLSSRLSLAQLQEINDQCNRFEEAWRSGQRPRLEDYLVDSPIRGPLLCQLILLDIAYRRQVGERSSAEDYLARFPDLDRSWLIAALAEETLGGAGGASPAPGTNVPVTVFLDRLAARDLITASEHVTLHQRLAALGPVSSEALAQELVAAGKLAEYQARALCAPVPIPFVIGPYVLDGWIAAGGMGQVFRGTHQRMKRTVAIKVVQGDAWAMPQLLKRFQQEVEVAALLRHPNIVCAFDAGEQEGVAYLVTEFIRGEDLGRLVRREGPVPIDRAVSLIQQTALGLAHAHARGIIHRDIKPSNLILGRDGTVRILDLGLARTTFAIVESKRPPIASGPIIQPADLTAVGELMGTVDFMAPEQAEDARFADKRSDIYSLGCTLHYLLLGRPPYDGPTTMERLLAHRKAPIPSLRAARPEVPPALDRLFQQMIAKKPADRLPSMEAVLAALDVRADPAPRRRFSRRVVLAATGTALAGMLGYLGFVGRSGWFTEKVELPPLPRIPFDARAEQKRWADALGVPVEIENTLGMRLVLIPPGSFMMGTPDAVIDRELRGPINSHQAAVLRSEKQREVTINQPYYLGVTEVTVGQFRRFVTATGYVTLAEKAPRDEEGGWGWHPIDGWRRKRGFSWKNADQLVLRDDHPVVNLSWKDAQAFCLWLTGPTERVCRLPTEAEWEFACRAGSAGLWHFGDEKNALVLHAWIKGVSGGILHRVAQKEANAFGLFDMYGNQKEWCAIAENAQREDRPSVKELGPWAAGHQPVRGGNFLSEANQVRSGARHWESPTSYEPGFRVLQVLPDHR